ncbi:hypothetical protein [Blautia glucerasea]|uniref:hypothetical protein n=1 Tax=Blautia glucerasea TaxID=536633 RepID=UPI00156EF4CC|nr:hypothetical protein [Blautia glucerasea]NSL04189.1 hypothetical protein [Blautia glucerasea]DAT79117.1 MAG TPA: hypothetical protein [Caudoviricetes sp.]
MEQLTGTMSSVPNSNNYENMSHKPQINGVELTGNKTSEELGLGSGSSVPVPTKVSELENDSKFQTEEQVKDIRDAVEKMGRRLDELVDGNEVAY